MSRLLDICLDIPQKGTYSQAYNFLINGRLDKIVRIPGISYQLRKGYFKIAQVPAMSALFSGEVRDPQKNRSEVRCS